MKNASIMIVLSVFLTAAFGAEVSLFYDPHGAATGCCWDWEGLISILTVDGHYVTRDSVFPNLLEYGIFYAFFSDTLYACEVEEIL